MMTIFHVQNLLIILDWCLHDFVVLKHIDEVDALHFHLSLTYFLCGKYSRISILLLIIYWCWLFFMCKMFLSFLTDVYVILLYWNILMKWMHLIFICYLHDFLCGKYSRIALLLLIIYWCWLFFMCKMFLSLLTDVYVIFLYWNISIKWMHLIFIFYLHDFLCGKYVCNFNTAFHYILMLTIFHVQNVLIIVDQCLCDFLCTETYRWSGQTSSSFVTCWCWHNFCVENILEFQYCFW